MKKLLMGVAAVALVISVSGVSAFAAGYGRNRNFVDNDNDGVCDYYDSSNQSVDSYGNSICNNYTFNGCKNGVGYADADGNGICDNSTSNGCGNGAGYADADGDSICDNSTSNGCQNGAGYADADGDGICDNFTTGNSQNGSGFKHGHCGGQGRHCK